MVEMPTLPAVVPMTAASEVYLCSGIPWDSSYSHVRLFDSKAAAVAYIISKAVYTITGNTPIRNMTFRANVSEDVVNKNINYIMYRNTNLTGEYFMGFVTDVKWLSVNSCEISFVFDIFQSWFYSVTLHPCFVVREHTNDDTVGANIIDEGIDYGDVINKYVDSPGSILFDTTPQAIVYVTETKGIDGTWSSVGGSLMGGVYSGLYPLVMPLETDDDKDALYLLLKDYIQDGKIDSVAFIQMTIRGITTNSVKQYALARPATIDGYTPRNKKLHCYPYIRAVVSNNLGSTAEFKWELSKTDATLIWEIAGYSTTQPVLKTTPLKYGGLDRDEMRALLYTNFPQCSWTSNAFYSWYAQNRNSLVVSNAYGLATSAFAVMTSNVAGLGALYSFSNSLLSKFATAKDTQTIPDSIKGHALNDNIAFAADLILPKIYTQTIRASYAKSLDSYFDLVGYKTNLIKVPNTTGRASWNYVETQDMQISGNIPKQYEDQLKEIFNKGVTLWHTNDIGNYGLDNSIVTGG